MAKTIRVSFETYEEINRRSKSMKDTADSVIRREFGMPQKGKENAISKRSKSSR
jgi:hypothetical protein